MLRLQSFLLVNGKRLKTSQYCKYRGTRAKIMTHSCLNCTQIIQLFNRADNAIQRMNRYLAQNICQSAPTGLSTGERDLSRGSMALSTLRTTGAWTLAVSDHAHSIIPIVSSRFASNRTHCVHPMSKVIFVCPNTATIVKRLAHSSYVDPQYENLWLVNKQSYERCEINRRTDTRLWLCDEPLKLKYYTVTFKRFSASNEPEFQPGKEYYFVATSDGRKTSINSTYGGNCRTNKMKLKFLVCTSSTDPRCKSEDMCNGVSPTQLQTSSRPTNPPVTVESHSTIKNSSCANKTHPTTTISNPDDPEKDDREKENDVLLREMTCKILIGFLAGLCILLIVLSTILMYKCHRKRKNRSSSSRDSASVVHKISNDSADGDV